MLKFDPNKPLRAGDVLLVEAKVRYGYDPNPRPGSEGSAYETERSVSVEVGYSQTSVPLDQVHGIARRRFKAGEEVIFGADQRGRVLSTYGEWLWLDLGSGNPASVHQESVTLPDADQPDLLAR